MSNREVVCWGSRECRAEPEETLKDACHTDWSENLGVTSVLWLCPQSHRTKVTVGEGRNNRKEGVLWYAWIKAAMVGQGPLDLPLTGLAHFQQGDQQYCRWR